MFLKIVFEQSTTFEMINLFCCFEEVNFIVRKKYKSSRQLFEVNADSSG